MEERKPYFREDDSGLPEKVDGMPPVVQGCLLASSINIGCMALFTAIVVFAIVMSRFVTFKQ